MAIVNAVKSGNWSDPTVWSVGSVPVNGDTVNAQGFAVELNVDIVQPLTILTGVGGRFLFTGGSTRNVTANADLGTHLVGGLVANFGSGKLNFFGNIKGGSGSNAVGAINVSTGEFNVFGTVTGGSNVTAVGASNQSSGQMNIATAIGGTAAHGATNTSNGKLAVDLAVGNGYGPGGFVTTAAAGVFGGTTNGSLTTVSRTQAGPLGSAAIAGAVLLNTAATVNTAQFLTTAATVITLADPATFADSPIPADVRAGTTYNFGINTGTCAVPLPGQTVVGVPVDDTVGTAVLTASAVDNVVWNKVRPETPTPGTYGAVDEWAGNIDVNAIATAVADEVERVGGMLAAVKARTDLITAGGVTIASPVRQDGTLNDLVVGDAYQVAAGRAIEMTIEDVSVGLQAILNAPGATVHLGFLRYGKSRQNPEFRRYEFPGSIVSVGSDTVVRFELSTDDTRDIVPSKYDYDVEFRSNANFVTAVSNAKGRPMEWAESATTLS